MSDARMAEWLPRQATRVVLLAATAALLPLVAMPAGPAFAQESAAAAVPVIDVHVGNHPG